MGNLDPFHRSVCALPDVGVQFDQQIVELLLGTASPVVGGGLLELNPLESVRSVGRSAGSLCRVLTLQGKVRPAAGSGAAGPDIGAFTLLNWCQLLDLDVELGSAIALWSLLHETDVLALVLVHDGSELYAERLDHFLAVTSLDVDRRARNAWRKTVTALDEQVIAAVAGPAFLAEEDVAFDAGVDVGHDLLAALQFEFADGLEVGEADLLVAVVAAVVGAILLPGMGLAREMVPSHVVEDSDAAQDETHFAVDDAVAGGVCGSEAASDEFPEDGDCNAGALLPRGTVSVRAETEIGKEKKTHWEAAEELRSGMEWLKQAEEVSKKGVLWCLVRKSDEVERHC